MKIGKIFAGGLMSLSLAAFAIPCGASAPWAPQDSTPSRAFVSNANQIAFGENAEEHHESSEKMERSHEGAERSTRHSDSDEEHSGTRNSIREHTPNTEEHEEHEHHQSEEHHSSQHPDSD